MFSRTGKEWAISKLKEKYKGELKLHRKLKANAKAKEAPSKKSGGAPVSPAQHHPYSALLERYSNTANYIPRDKPIDLTTPQTYSSEILVTNEPSLRKVSRTGPASKKRLSDTFKASIEKKKANYKETKKYHEGQTESNYRKYKKGVWSS